ncbi:MAG TPA: hypothetical protein PLL30_02795 [Candidatus Krumholzibacteria bacterium]|nr:hypothetical protein [Candidatus Krumholzibacteria bacterium]HPD70698.1 hypothetical protein [Candidatus Krumholzibacteria bacterium]HRY39602.1 hypothetical protein [Candidatus Krumholzibacteria bacterium]
MNLIAACGLAFGAVIVLLGALAALMRVITAVLPVARPGLDPVVAAAITSVITAFMQGARATRIEEEL